MSDAALEGWLNKVFDESFPNREEDVANLLKTLVAEGTLPVEADAFRACLLVIA